MKHTLTFVSIILFTACAIAQTNSSVKIISKENLQVLNGSSIDDSSEYIIYGDASREAKEEFFTVLESSASTLVAIKRRELSVISGSEDYFCWYVCYLSVAAGTKELWYASDSLMMTKDDTVHKFSVYLVPHGTKGKACYRYTFQPADNPSDSSWFDVCFVFETLGMPENSDPRIRVFPNPVTDAIRIDVPVGNGNEHIMNLYRADGRLVFTRRLAEGMNVISRDKGLLSGIYLLNVTNGNTVLLTQKVVFE